MRNKVFKIAFGGILLALFSIFMYFESISPVLNRTMLVLSTLFVMLAVIELGVKLGMTFYIAASLLGFLILPDKTGIIMFVLFFGPYAIVKYFAEKINGRFKSLAVKFAFFNVMLLVLFLGFRSIFDSIVPQSVLNIDMKWIYVIIVLVLEVAFYLYDAALSVFSFFYTSRIRSKL